MNFDSDLNSKILVSLLGVILGSCLTAWWTNKRSKRDLCLKIYERWISESMSQSRRRAFKALQIFFEPAFSDNELIKLSQLQYLSKPSHNYKPAEYWSEDFIDDFLQITTFICDLNKLTRQKLIDVQLSKSIFRDTILPWYIYFDKLEFDLSNEMDNEYLKSEINSLRGFIQ